MYLYIYLLKFFPSNFFYINNIFLLNVFNKNNNNFFLLSKTNNLNLLKTNNFKQINFKLSSILFSSFKNDSVSFFFKKKFNNNTLSNFLFLKQNFYFFNFFYNYCLYKNNFIILDSNYSSLYPLYKHLYGYNHLSLYKSFFFIEPKNFVLKNWFFFFLKFCNFNKINLLFIFDYDYYVNFYKNINNSELSVSAIVPYSYIDNYIDYPLYSFNINIITKMLYSSYILYIYSISYNYINFLNQYKYVLFFKKFYIL